MQKLSSFAASRVRICCDSKGSHGPAILNPTIHLIKPRESLRSQFLCTNLKKCKRLRVESQGPLISKGSQQIYFLGSRRARDVKDSLLFNSFHMQRIFSTATAESARESSSGKKYASYTIFKGKAALTVYPVLPKFCAIDSGRLKMEKNGVVMLVFWPAIANRKYDWEKRQYFALSPTEVGSLVSLGSSDSCEFLHDPSMKSSSEGQIKKSLTIAPINDQSGYFANLNVVNNLSKTNDRLSVAITKAEFTVLRTACSYVLPHIMGWDHVISPEKQTTPKSAVDRPHPDFEWSR